MLYRITLTKSKCGGEVEFPPHRFENRSMAYAVFEALDLETIYDNNAEADVTFSAVFEVVDDFGSVAEVGYKEYPETIYLKMEE